jgi:hypothetical protein
VFQARIHASAHVFGQALALGAEDERRHRPKREVAERFSAAGHEPYAGSGRVLEAAERDAEDRAHRRPQRLRPSRVGAPGRQAHGRAERVGGADQRPDVAGVPHPPQRERRRVRGKRRQVGAAEDSEDPRRVRERRDAGDKPGVHVLARDEEIDGLGAGVAARLNEVFALHDE